MVPDPVVQNHTFEIVIIICRDILGERTKKVFFLIAVPLRPYPPPPHRAGNIFLFEANNDQKYVRPVIAWIRILIVNKIFRIHIPGEGEGGDGQGHRGATQGDRTEAEPTLIEGDCLILLVERKY